jgi:hypothetical protein
MPPLPISVCFTLVFLTAGIAVSSPRLHFRPTIAATDNHLFASIDWIDLGVLLKELPVVVTGQPVLVVGWAQYAPLEILAWTTVCKPALA